MPTLAIKLRGSDEYEIDITPVTDLDAGVGYTHPVTGEYVITSRPIHAGKLGAAYRTGLFRCLKANRADVFTPGDELTFTGTGVVAGADTLTVVRPSSAGDVFVEAELNPPGTGGGGGGLSQSQVDARIKGRPVYRFGGTQGSETGKGTEVTIGEWGSTAVLNHAAEVIYVPSVGGPVTRIEHQAFDGASWQIISVDTPPSRQQPDPANLAARESATTKPNGYESFPETNKQRYVVVNGAWVWDESYVARLASTSAVDALTEMETAQRVDIVDTVTSQYLQMYWQVVDAEHPSPQYPAWVIIRDLPSGTIRVEPGDTLTYAGGDAYNKRAISLPYTGVDWELEFYAPTPATISFVAFGSYQGVQTNAIDGDPVLYFHSNQVLTRPDGWAGSNPFNNWQDQRINIRRSGTNMEAFLNGVSFATGAEAADPQYINFGGYTGSAVFRNVRIRIDEGPWEKVDWDDTQNVTISPS